MASDTIIRIRRLALARFHKAVRFVTVIKCLGNAVVPQQFYLFFKLIHDIEEEQ